MTKGENNDFDCEEGGEIIVGKRNKAEKGSK